MFPGGEIYDVSKFLYDVAHYKKGDKAKIVADLVALGIDGAAAFADEIIDAAKIAKRVAAKRAAKLIDPKLMDELAKSGLKYNSEAVQMVTKNTDGKLLWLETGSDSAGLKHILKHKADLLAKGVNVDDIPSFIKYDLLTQVPTKVGRNTKGPYSEYLFSEQKFRLAYGDNGYIISLYPIKGE